MELTEKEQTLIQSYQKASANMKLGVDKLLGISLSRPEVTSSDPASDLMLPPYPILKDVEFWITAIDDSFKADGIEKGDLLGCYYLDEDFDEPKTIHILTLPGEPCFVLGKIDFKTDYGTPGVMIYLNSEFTQKQFVSQEDIFSTVRDLGAVKLVLKCK